MSSTLLLQQGPACLVCLTWMVCEMGGKWPYSHFLLGAGISRLVHLPQLLKTMSICAEERHGLLLTGY